ncbi:hypothetical protein DM01DRAFT_1396586, partial [Hesseltinella vesiculosa]
MGTVSKYSAFKGNPLKTKTDVQEAFKVMFEALIPGFSPGRARVRLEQAGAHFDPDAADLEGFARPLWGIVPFAAGGGHFDHWDLYNQGFTAGVDPKHPEYWGDPVDYNQRLVELAAIGFALALVPEHIWTPLPEATKANLSAYLVTGRNCKFHDNNWKYFRVLIDLGLKRVGVDFDSKMTEKYLQELEAFYIGDGFYGDGPLRNRMDYYNPWALQFYALLYARLCPEDKDRQTRFRERSRAFANQYQHWFSDDGSAIPFGRSLVYRFACGSFWGACAFANEQVLPWGVLKGLYLRHLRWWSQQPVSRVNSDILSLGYAYPNSFVCEHYNSPQSPYWATKVFIALAVPDDHPFWTANEESHLCAPISLQPTSGMVITHFPKNTTALMSGPSHLADVVRFQAEKYCKFAYSTRYGFSVDVNAYSFVNAALDNMIGFSEDGEQFKVRTGTKAKMYQDKIYATWSPWPDVQVETLLAPRGKWHVRLHKIHSGRDLFAIEGGFAIANQENIDTNIRLYHTDRIHITNGIDVSCVVDLIGNRKPRVCYPEPNSNIMAPRTKVPQLRGKIVANEITVFAAAFLAMPDMSVLETDWLSVPQCLSEHDFQNVKDNGLPVFNE